MQSENGVVIARHVQFACADSNQKDMISDIREHQLDAIVVASCSPKLHLHTFRGVAERAGINPFNYVQVNIREQCSWPHSDRPKEATIKAAGLIRAGIRRVAHSEALEHISIEAKKAVLVVGAGVAGMRAAIDLARQGLQVYLIEKDYFVGGRVAQAGELFMTGQNGKQLVEKLYNEIKKLSTITLFTGATIGKVSGSVGNFNAEININPRYTTAKTDATTWQNIINDCPAQAPNEFNYGLTLRKAVYKNYPEALPDIPAIDAKALKNEPEFLKKYERFIDVNKQPEILHLAIGSVLVTTGFDPYQPKDDEYGYKKFDRVITLPEFQRLIELNPETLIYMGKAIHKIAFIYCVGNRQAKGENKYCSRFCCTTAIHTSIRINEKYKNIKSIHLFRDIRTYGKQEILYEKSCRQGDLYLKFDEKDPPVVTMQNGNLTIKVKDILTAKKEIELETDLVVLVTGALPRNDSGMVAEKLKIPIGSDKFFNEIHPKLKPVETVIKGVFIGGSCQGPKNISESVQSSLSAVAKINELIKKGTISLDPVVARINTDACTWCGKCAAVCEYDAIKETNDGSKAIAFVNTASCMGCGICAPVCPSDAIEIAQYTNREIEGMIAGFAQEAEISEPALNSEQQQEKSEVTMKELPQLWKRISGALAEKPKTIPQIASELCVDSHLITYHLMTMDKYSIVIPDGLDEKEQYYLYKLKTT